MIENGLNTNRTSPAKIIALVGIMAASVECAKLALMFLPNIEAVTLLLALYGYIFGIWGVVSAVVFVCIEPMLFGFGSWVVSYFIYWPLVALVFMILGRLRVKNRLILTGTAVLLTFFFGILTSLVDLGLFSGFFENFLERFLIYYARGVYFYIAQIITNLVLFLFLFKPLCKKLAKIKCRFIKSESDPNE